MAMIGEFVAGKAFEALYAGVEELIRRNLIFKSLFQDIKSSLDSLKPLIQDMALYNQQLDCPKKELEALDALMMDGLELVAKCLEISRWNAAKKFKYANQLSEWDATLERQLKILNVQGIRDGKKAAVSVKKIEVSVGNIVEELKNMKEEVSQMTEANLATQNQSTETKAWCAVPELPKLTVGLDVPLEELKMKLLEPPPGCYIWETVKRN